MLKQGAGIGIIVCFNVFPRSKEADIRALGKALCQMGAFRMVGGVLLGTFTDLEWPAGPQIPELMTRALDGIRLPIAQIRETGHPLSL